MWSRKSWVRSPKSIVDEIEHLVNNFKVREILVYDDTFNIDLQRAEAVCDEIMRRELNIIWRAQLRAYPLSEKLLLKMKESGCWCVYFGVESGNDTILKKNNKRLTLKQVSNAISMAKMVGLRVAGYFMFGLYGETKENMIQTIDFAEQLNPDFAVFSVTTLYPGTELYDLSLKEGLSESLTYESRYSPCIYESSNFNKQELWQMRKRALIKFYLRPKFLFRHTLQIRTWAEFKASLRAGYSVLFA